MLASTVQFSSYGQNQPHLTPTTPTGPKPSKRVMMSGQSQTYDNTRVPPGAGAEVRATCVARSLRTQQRAQTTDRPQFVFHPGKPEVLTLKPADDQLIDVPP